MRWWDGSWHAQCLGPGAGETLFDRADLFSSSALLLSGALERESPVGLFAAGSHGAWDTPYQIGPGIERASVWLDGQSTTGPAISEGLVHTLSPALLGRMRWVAPDPFLDPLAMAGDGVLWGETEDPVWTDIPSTLRMTDGPSGASAEDAMLARQAGAWRALGSYAHGHAEGRVLYGPGRFQNLLFRLERSQRPAALRLTVADRAGRYTLTESRKMVWEASQLSIGAQTSWGELQVSRRADRLEWWGDGTDGRRRSKLWTARLQIRRRMGPVMGLATGALERCEFDWTTRRAGSADWTDTGTGLAIGVQGRGGLVTIGHADPWWTDGHWRAHVHTSTGRTLPIRITVEGWTGRAPVFVPRLEPDGEATILEGLHFDVGGPDDGGPVRRSWHAELRAAVGGLEAGCFLRRLENALGLDPDAGWHLRPTARLGSDLDSLLQSATLTGGLLRLRFDLPLGAEIAGDATAVLRPATRDLPLLVPAYRGRGVASVGGDLFRQDLFWEARLIGLFQGEWHTPVGDVPARVRLDGELHGTIGRTHLFVALRNVTALPNDAENWGESATHDEGWMPLPGRGYEVGLEWHFLD